MGVLDTVNALGQNNAPVANQSNGRRRLPGAQDDFVKSNLWLNVGYQSGDKFINLPVGLPVDTMKPADARGQNEDWLRQRAAQNYLLEMLQKAGAEMEPGQEVSLKLEVRLRRTQEKVDVDPDTNPYGIALTDIFHVGE